MPEVRTFSLVSASGVGVIPTTVRTTRSRHPSSAAKHFASKLRKIGKLKDDETTVKILEDAPNASPRSYTVKYLGESEFQTEAGATISFPKYSIRSHNAKSIPPCRPNSARSASPRRGKKSPSASKKSPSASKKSPSASKKSPKKSPSAASKKSPSRK